jgi:hypothetical protein
MALRAKLRSAWGSCLSVVQRLIETFLQRADIGQSRTSALNPLQWMMVIVCFGLFLLIIAHAPAWVVIVLVVLLFALCLFFLHCFNYFMRHNPDALRSEKFVFSKLAIERGLVGDSLVGLFQESTAIVPVGGESTAGKNEP